MKLEEIQELINSLRIDEIFDDLDSLTLSQLGEFVLKLERIVQRDDVTIKDLKNKFDF